MNKAQAYNNLVQFFQPMFVQEWLNTFPDAQDFGSKDLVFNTFIEWLNNYPNSIDSVPE